MKTNATLELVNRFEEVIKLDLQRDIEEINKFIDVSLKTALRFPIFKELEVRIAGSSLPKNAARLLTPTHDIDRLFLVVYYSELTEILEQETVYFKWEYRHHDGMTYAAKTFTNIKKMIKMDALLTS